MRQREVPQIPKHETKERIPVWLYPTTLETIDHAMGNANCKTRSEFLDYAARFYAGYISSEDADAFLSETLMASLRAAIQNSDTRTGRLLFKLAVEVSMMTKVFAMGLKIDPKNLEKLRGQCVSEVKKSNGSVSFRDAVEKEQ